MIAVIAASCWAGIERIYHAATVRDALKYGTFDGSTIFAQLARPTTARGIQATRLPREEAVAVWRLDAVKPDKVPC
ncbi:MAG: hypothetical protein AB7O95_28650 [Geminicoccaceae bacterium]